MRAPISTAPTRYRGKHELELAKADLEQALRLDPNLAAAKKALDDVTKLLGNRAVAPTAQ